jgi:UDP-glucose 4-epimerase
MGAAGRRVVIIGVSSFWGAALAHRLERNPGIDHILGIDSRPPPSALGRTEFIDADIRNPVLARLLPTTGVETIVHCGVLWYPEPGAPASALHEINVIGTLQLLAACERTETVRHVIVRGSV